MKEPLWEMYDRITMPQETQKKIHQAMMQKEATKKISVRTIAKRFASVAAVFLLLLVVSPTARAAMNQWIVKYFWSDSDITIYEQVGVDGEVEATVAVVDTEAPAFARIVNGRLYFMGNHEKIDITDLIKEDTPYYYRYVDEYGLTHEMAVGYSGSLENFGIYEFIWKETEGIKNWTMGTGRNFMNAETEKCYSWVDIVWEDLDIPWNKPE